MTTKRTASTRLRGFARYCTVQGTPFAFGSMSNDELVLVKTVQELLADILSLDVMQDEVRPLEGPKRNGIEQGLRRTRNKTRAELRQALQDYFMGGDVGVDMGSSQDAADAKGGRT